MNSDDQPTDVLRLESNVEFYDKAPQINEDTTDLALFTI